MYKKYFEKRVFSKFKVNLGVLSRFQVNLRSNRVFFLLLFTLFKLNVNLFILLVFNSYYVVS